MNRIAGVLFIVGLVTACGGAVQDGEQDQTGVKALRYVSRIAVAHELNDNVIVDHWDDSHLKINPHTQTVCGGKVVVISAGEEKSIDYSFSAKRGVVVGNAPDPRLLEGVKLCFEGISTPGNILGTEIK